MPQSRYSSSLSEIRKEKYNSMTSTSRPYSSDAYQSPTLKNISSPMKNISSQRNSFPLYSDHVARYYQRISDIFETNESDQTDKYEAVRKPSVLKSREQVAVKTTYKTVLEDVKDLEKKYRRMNEEEERRRPRTDLDHYRPDAVLHNSKTPQQFQKLASTETEKDVRGSSYDKLYSRTLQLYRDAATPPSSTINSMSTNYHPHQLPSTLPDISLPISKLTITLTEKQGTREHSIMLFYIFVKDDNIQLFA